MDTVIDPTHVEAVATTNQQVADLIKEIESEFPGPDDAILAETAPASPEKPQDAPGGQEGGAPAPDSGVEKDPADRSLARLVEREVSIATKETALAAREKTLQAAEQETAGLRAKAAQMEALIRDIQELAEYDPGDLFRKLNKDPDEMVQRYLAKKLGDKAPEELKRSIREMEYARKIRDLEARDADRERQAHATAYFNQVAAEVQKFVQGEDLSKHAPKTALLAKNNAQMVHQMMLDVIQADANARKDEDRNAPLLSFQEAARRLENWLGPIAAAYQPTAPEQGAQPSKTPADKPERKPDVVVTKQSTVPQPLGAKRPFWQQDDETRESAIKEAVGEAYRLNRW